MHYNLQNLLKHYVKHLSIFQGIRITHRFGAIKSSLRFYITVFLLEKMIIIFNLSNVIIFYIVEDIFLLKLRSLNVVKVCLS